jgi:hypothetical protein
MKKSKRGPEAKALSEDVKRVILAIALDIAREDHDRAMRARKDPRKRVLIPRRFDQARDVGEADSLLAQRIE